MEWAIVDLAVKTYLMLQSVDKFLLEQKSLVNKSQRQLLPVVLQRQQLADALARYMAQLGLKRRAKPAPSLREYLRTRTHGETEEADERQNDHEHEEVPTALSCSRTARSHARQSVYPTTTPHLQILTKDQA